MQTLKTLEDCSLRQYLEANLPNFLFMQQFEIEPDDLNEMEEEEEEEDDEEEIEAMHLPLSSVLMKIVCTEEIPKRHLAYLIVGFLTLCEYDLYVEEIREDNDLYDEEAAQYASLTESPLLSPRQHICGDRDGEYINILIFHDEKTALVVQRENVHLA